MFSMHCYTKCIKDVSITVHNSALYKFTLYYMTLQLWFAITLVNVLMLTMTVQV